MKEQSKATQDMRSKPLPRCPACGSAVAYDQEKCFKCGHQLKTIPPLRS